MYPSASLFVSTVFTPAIVIYLSLYVELKFSCFCKSEYLLKSPRTWHTSSRLLLIKIFSNIIFSARTDVFGISYVVSLFCRLAIYVGRTVTETKISKSINPPKSIRFLAIL